MSFLDKIKRNYLYILEILVFIFFFCYLTFYTNSSKFGHFKLNRLTIIIYIIGLLSIVAFSFIFHKFKRLKVEDKFLIIMPVLGILYLIIFPFNTIPDEANHASRAYEISNGHLTSHIYKDVIGNKLDSSLYSVASNDTYSNLISNLKYKMTNKKVKYSFANTSLYSPVSYLPQALGITISRIFTKHILVQLYFGRIFNFLAFFTLMYFAIKLIPFKKEIVLLISVIPLVLQEAVSLAPDAFTISLVCFFVSYILYLRGNRKKITFKNIAIISVASIVLSQLKIVYLPVCLLMFLLPLDKFKSKKNKHLTLITIFLVSALFGLLWLKISSPYLEAQSGSDKQLNYILANVFRYLGVCTSTFITFSRDWLYEMFGRSLGSFTIAIPSFLIFLNIIFFILISLTSKDKKENIKEWEKWLIAFVILAVIALIFTSLYLQWTPYKADLIKGIQGRYFIPLLLLISLVLTNKKIVFNGKSNSKYLESFLIFENICAISIIIIYFM